MEKMKWNNNSSGDHQRLKEFSWDGGFEKDRAYGFSWPQRNYRCSFCKKEFKSAQALGGHMNVHRRDRARMRLSSPSSWDSSSIHINIPNPNPNPNLVVPAAAKFVPYNNYMTCHSSLTSLSDIHHSPSSTSLQEEKVVIEHSRNDDIFMKKVSWGGDHDRGKKKKSEMVEFMNSSLTRRKDARVWKANYDQYVRLDLNMGLIQDPKEDLDLELRLGYSN